MEDRMEVFLERYRKQPPAYIIELEKTARKEQVPIIRRATRDILGYMLRTKKSENVLEVGNGHRLFCFVYERKYAENNAGLQL